MIPNWETRRNIQQPTFGGFSFASNETETANRNRQLPFSALRPAQIVL